MSIKERKERERKEKRLQIVNAARILLKNEGIEGISIRKIAKMIEYSPTMIYHYFANKDEIINELMRQGYIKILNSLNMNKHDNVSAIDQFRENIKRYINMAIKHADEYHSILLNDSKMILNHTSVLSIGASKNRQTIKILCNLIEDITNQKEKKFEGEEVELIAQVI
ncbi:TetR/AcrR family transcriptional regulator [Haloplasma contractile]|uniref:Transcriptional regulator TetR family protein n=1 Tax=Haloplasma contractile SSD-17B TaxID=1033810 RepID=U2DU83_9MOLU|nr:TetR/AcrR family transcriptional regulator [Haloplasma contractile]ERJ11987.1 Transcriptional regulator TetR family protein [Haloplasma contractile SSD-17B]